MKTQIYYAITQMKEPSNQFFNKYFTIALAETDDKSGCFSVDSSESIMSFDTYNEAYNYITQISKPNYYDWFGSNYELIEMDGNSDEWYTLYDKFIVFRHELNNVTKKVVEYFQLPLWKRIIYDIWSSNSLVNMVINLIHRK